MLKRFLINFFSLLGNLSVRDSNRLARSPDEGRSFQSKRVSNPLEPSYVISPSFCANPNFSTEKENSALEKSLSPQSFSNAYRTIFGEQQKAYSIGPVPKKFATDHISQKLQVRSSN